MNLYSYEALMLLLTKLGGALIRNGTYNGLATDLQRISNGLTTVFI